MIESWAAYFESLLNNPVNNSGGIDPPVSDVLANIEDSAPNNWEVTLSLKALKLGESSATDQLQPEFFKFAADELAPLLSAWFGKIGTDTDIPKDWQDNIVTLHKNGDKALCSNYRGISLLNIAYKVLEIVSPKWFEPAF